MTIVFTAQQGYLERPYQTDPYLTSGRLGQIGLQFQGKIDDDKPLGLQYESSIIDRLKYLAVQYESNIIDAKKYLGVQHEANILNYPKSIGGEFEAKILDKLKEFGLEFSSMIDAFKATYGTQFESIILDTLVANGVEFKGDLNITDSTGTQYEGFIFNYPKNNALEFRESNILHLWQGSYLLYAGYLTDPYLASKMHALIGLQYESAVKDIHKPIGVQFEGNIINRLKTFGVQIEYVINALDALGVEFDSVTVKPMGLQTRYVIYNSYNLRILCEFSSRGATDGLNWTASSTAAGDFSANNLNTDIVEQIWRSVTGVKTGITLDCDTEVTQVFVDTFAMLNHNLTTSANVTLTGSNNPSHSPAGIIHTIQVTEDNAYWISEDLPLNGYRYWRLSIDDNTNPENFISIGTILFGDSEIFSGECFVDELDFKYNDFSDKVFTQGHTNVSNSLALKRYLKLEFRMLRSLGGNFNLLRTMFKRFRTTHKCLWIPTPSPFDQTITDRYAVYGKLVDIPNEGHKSLGATKDYASFFIEVDESK